MIKKHITYTDFNGQQRTEEYYFNLTKAEVAEMELSIEGGLGKRIEQIVAAKDNASIVSLFKDLIGRSYGLKSEDGRRFIKTKELTEEFLQTEAYSELFIELATNADAATAFVEGILPKNLNN